VSGLSLAGVEKQKLLLMEDQPYQTNHFILVIKYTIAVETTYQKIKFECFEGIA
jgi:hypothetical protein